MVRRVTPQEAAALLGIAASFDNRKPDPDAALAWSVALTGLRFEDCRDAIVQHYIRSKEWLMPTDVIGAVRKMRDKRIASAPPLVPPPGLDVAGELQWRREEIKRIGDGLPPSPETRVLVSRGEVVLPELPPMPPAHPESSKRKDDEARARARAELANVVPAEVPEGSAA